MRTPTSLRPLVARLRAHTRPQVATIHPGLAAVALLAVVAHLGLAADAIFGQHESRTWDFFGSGSGVIVLGAAHLGIAVVVTVGTYTRWALVRAGFLASVTLYLICAGLFITAWIVQYLTGDGWTFALRDGVFNAVLAGISAAAYNEPLTRHQPATGPPASLADRAGHSTPGGPRPARETAAEAAARPAEPVHGATTASILARQQRGTR